MTLTVDPQSAVPPYEQLRRQVSEQVRRGERPPGSSLPTVRQLAGDLGLAPNTVARAYKALEHDGIVATAGRRGTVVADPHVEVAAEAHRQTLDFVARLRGLGVSSSETIRLVRQVLDETR